MNSHRPPTFLCEVQINQYNQQFSVGDQVTFSIQDNARQLAGTVLKKYTNSCLIDITQTNALNKREQEIYNGRVVVNYRKINEVKIHEQ
ncbi:DUF2187 family protein [Enterococcus sp. 669A]|uniref:DUF2187 family protein n=1 Tax=Candidatus Enterococcus moelleringii TaxID=2815325 RepID=A0ABS3L502_9ENTE|nr:DUF2187 family protein [Enterococcus sp. 669A]MBO1304701.1 DUF2187 family protein [Enterococcus sp. 669A]